MQVKSAGHGPDLDLIDTDAADRRDQRGSSSFAASRKRGLDRQEASPHRLDDRHD